ncbi:MAG: ABC-F family ATP-binding cassette domain-containing protein [Candidatus Moranbacteria bacterium]|nr:ABC-F family ATP-binding cassette domain-containing protein [Candidatus Moranbacteria bacterium]
MLTLKNIRKIYGTRRVLERISFSLGEGQKVALVGQNGAGKSTLLRIIAGNESPDRGEVQKPNRVLIGYLPQEMMGESRETLLDYLRRAAGLIDLEEKMTTLESRLEKSDALTIYEAYQEEYRRLGGYDFVRKAKRVLTGLRLSSLGLDRHVDTLSGGEKRKAALAGVLLRGVDVLLLDEPTNNLDLPALLWLERYLKRSKATVIIASHDRRFLDRVVEKIIEIDWYKREAIMYAGNWSAYAETKARLFRKLKEEYRLQEEERSRLFVSMEQKMDWVERTKNSRAPDRDKLTSNFKKERATKKFTASAKALESREKRLRAVDRPLERPPLIMPLTLKNKEGGRIVLQKARCGYPGGFVSQLIDLKIPFGTRIAFLGDNGAGKSTLLQTVAGTLPLVQGKRTCGKEVVFGYLMQEHENVPLKATVFSFFRERTGMFDRDVFVDYLTRYQFAPDVLDDKVCTFSPGERVRLVLCLLAILGMNTLLLDEPTNHLDLEAIEALEEALEYFPGTVLLVTHDRLFLERLRIDTYYCLENGALSVIADYATYEKSFKI